MEWVGLVLLAALSLGGLASAAPAVDGRSFGGFLAHRIVCAVKRGCDDGDAGLGRAHGRRDAALLRSHAPNIVYEPGEESLPVDWRRCRSRRCSDADDDRDSDVHRSRSGRRATVFTRVVRRRGRLYLQYWLYYPDSNTTWAGSDRLWERSRLLPLVARALGGSGRYPGFHPDDWEGYQVRIDPDGSTWARATAHGHYQGCKQRRCRNRWIGSTRWTRVSRGSHAGHIPVERRGGRFEPRYPGRDMRERTSTSEGLHLVPLEGIDRRRYRRLDRPPWQKPSYRDAESGSS